MNNKIQYLTYTINRSTKHAIFHTAGSFHPRSKPRGIFAGPCHPQSLEESTSFSFPLYLQSRYPDYCNTMNSVRSFVTVRVHVEAAADEAILVWLETCTIYQLCETGQSIQTTQFGYPRGNVLSQSNHTSTQIVYSAKLHHCTRVDVSQLRVPRHSCTHNEYQQTIQNISSM